MNFCGFNHSQKILMKIFQITVCTHTTHLNCETHIRICSITTYDYIIILSLSTVVHIIKYGST